MHDRTEQCQFYRRTGACRHGETCSRTHMHPTRSRTLMFPALWDNPRYKRGRKRGEGHEVNFDDKLIQESLDRMFQDVFVELASKYGEIEQMAICENTTDHLSGNVYVRFKDEKDAIKCLKAVNDRWYNGYPIFCELCPVTDLDESSCRQAFRGECSRGGQCNFLHVRRPSKALETHLYDAEYKKYHM